MADYHRCTPEPDCFDGQIKIGPFEHYPGSPGYNGYTTWIEDNTQYVKTSYSKIINEYPEQSDYNLNTSSWVQITDNLGSGTTSVTIPAADFVQGVNILYFQETNTFSTKFEWTLYIDQGAVPEEYTNVLVYDTFGNAISITDTRGNTTSLSYDLNHIYLTSLTNALNHTTYMTYDSATGWLTSITDAKGNTVTCEYDLLGRVKKKIYPDLTELEIVYDDQNNTTTVSDELDHCTTRYYDGLCRLIQVEWYLSPAENLTETYTYNYQGNIKIKTDLSGYTYLYEYDSTGRTTRVINADSTYKEMQYDDVSSSVVFFDENQHKTECHYNWVGNLLWVKEYTAPADYYLTQYMYDSVGNVTSVTDANGNTTSYEYGSPFGITQTTYPDSTTETFSYDNVGNLLHRTDASGTTTFTYNAIYQLIGIQYPDQPTVTYNYDPNGNPTCITDAAGTTSYTYDNRNRVTSETRTLDGQPLTVQYGYDAASRLTSMIYPDQSVVTYQYDPLNRLTRIPGYADFLYTSDSLLASTLYSNGVETTYQYDRRGRPILLYTQKEGVDLLTMNYQYDMVGNITHMEYNRRLPGQQWVESSERFQYDWLDRLVEAQGDYGVFSYSYDAVGNRQTENDLTYTYNNMNELLSISDGTTFTYDGVGNTLQRTDSNTWSYTYDKRNLLRQVEKNQQVVDQYEYDGNGRRVKKTEWIESLTDYQSKIYSYSGMDVIYEKNSCTAQEALYVYGPTGRIAKRVGDFIDFYHTDHLGSTRLITDESGTVTTDVQYTPFGDSTVHGEEDYTYTGKECDSCGLYYYGARYYDPETGRFISRDPVKGRLSNPQSLNPYTYCLNNPLKYIDPTGLVTMSNVETGVSITQTKHGWIAEGKDGTTITKAEVDSLIEQGKYLEAMEKILSVLGYDMENASIVYYSENPEERPEERWYITFEGHIKFMVDGREVTFFLDLTDNVESAGHTFRMEINGPLEVHMMLSETTTLTAERLFLLVGHEMQHVEHHVSGKYIQWEWTYGPEGAKAYSEMEATMWNIRICLFSSPFRCYLLEHLRYLSGWMRVFENRPLDGR